MTMTNERYNLILRKYLQQSQEVAFLPDDSVWRNRFNIKSGSSNRLYVIAQRISDGVWGCSCPGWIIKKEGKPRTCKHIQAIQPAITAAEQKAEKEFKLLK